MDGSSTRKYSGANGPSGEECKVAIQFQFATTINKAEYEAMIAEMNIA
jgi:hypothetical protein